MLNLQKLIDAINITRKTRGEQPLEVEASDIIADIAAALIEKGVTKVSEKINHKKAPKE